MTHSHQLHQFHLSYDQCEESVCFSVNACTLVADFLFPDSVAQFDVASQDTKERLIPHKSTVCLQFDNPSSWGINKLHS